MCACVTLLQALVGIMVSFCFVLSIFIGQLISGLDVNEQSIQDGKKQYELLKTQAEMPNYGEFSHCPLLPIFFFT